MGITFLEVLFVTKDKTTLLQDKSRLETVLSAYQAEHARLEARLEGAPAPLRLDIRANIVAVKSLKTDVIHSLRLLEEQIG